MTLGVAGYLMCYDDEVQSSSSSDMLYHKTINCCFVPIGFVRRMNNNLRRFYLCHCGEMA